MLEFVLIVILTLFLLRQIPSFGAAIAGSAAIGIDGMREFRNIGRDTQAGWNRLHGLQPDGRHKFAAKNREDQRAAWVARKREQFTSLSGTPGDARASAVKAAEQAGTGKKAAFDQYIPGQDREGTRPGDDGFDLMTRRGRE